MRSYLDLLNRVRLHGDRMPCGAVLRSTGERAMTRSLFGERWEHDLGGGFPLLTTKAVHWHSARVELAWMLRGETNVGFLRKHGVTIWDEWANADGELGPIYGRQWRDFGGVDQIATLVCNLRATSADPGDRARRRMILSAWNVGQIGRMALPPCHYAAQFDVRGARVSCMVHMRSCDVFIGLPFNIASYALLTHLLAREAGLGVGRLIFTFGDLHLYENHVAPALEQLEREPGPLPTLRLGGGLAEFEQDPTIAEVVGYEHLGRIAAEVAV